MERKFLERLGLEKDSIDKVLAQYESEMQTQQQTIQTLTAERDGLQKQLETAHTEIKSYQDMDIEGIQKKAAEWETKYNQDTAALQEQLDSVRYDFSAKEAVAPLKFTSESAKKAFLADLTAKKLPMQDGKLLGMDDFIKSYQEADPSAFVSERDAQTPVFTKGIGGTGAIGGTFGFHFASVRPQKNKGEN